jgi:hypothetical protein
MDREGGYAHRAHLLYQLTLEALAAGQTYDCFVIMLERSKCIAEWKLSGEELGERIGERMLELHGRLQQLTQTSAARLAYARQAR